MWEQYRKTAVVMQGFIVAACAAMKYFMRLPWPAVAVMFVVMQLGALLGAWWGARLRRKLTAQEEELPLRRKL
jgi:uncharacterized membrane protein YfcA